MAFNKELNKVPCSRHMIIRTYNKGPFFSPERMISVRKFKNAVVHAKGILSKSILRNKVYQRPPWCNVSDMTKYQAKTFFMLSFVFLCIIEWPHTDVSY